MDDHALLVSLGVARPSRRDVTTAYGDAFVGIAPREGERHRLFDECSTIGLMIGQAVDRNASCKSAVRRLQIEFGADASSSTAAYCKARKRVRIETVREMSRQISEEAVRICSFGRFRHVNALDGTSFQADDSEANRTEWPYAPGQKAGCGFPVIGAMISHSLVGGGSQVLVTAPWKAHDFRLFAACEEHFGEGDLEIGDRAFCSFAAFAILAARKADGIFRGRDWCLKTRHDDVMLGEGDRITRWRKPSPSNMKAVSKTRSDEFPSEITVRVITARIRARGFRDEEIIVVTSLLDDKEFPKETILEWYLRRWEIEVSFRDVKTTLRYEFIRGRSPDIVRLEIEIVFLAYNLMRYVMSRGSPGRSKPRFGIASTAAAIRSFLAVLQTVVKSGRSCARAFAHLIKAVASDPLEKRKRRMNVRAVKRRPKPYRLLTKPRSEYRPEECL